MFLFSGADPTVWYYLHAGNLSKTITSTLLMRISWHLPRQLQCKGELSFVQEFDGLLTLIIPIQVAYFARFQAIALRIRKNNGAYEAIQCGPGDWSQKAKDFWSASHICDSSFDRPAGTSIQKEGTVWFSAEAGLGGPGTRGKGSWSRPWLV